MWTTWRVVLSYRQKGGELRPNEESVTKLVVLLHFQRHKGEVQSESLRVVETENEGPFGLRHDVS